MITKRILTLLAGFALTAAACGGSSDANPLSTTATTAATTTSAATTSTTTTSTTSTTSTTTTSTTTTTTSTTTTTLPATEQEIFLAENVADCRDGDDLACDLAYVFSEEGSPEEEIGLTCAGRGDAFCTGYDVDYSQAYGYGEDPLLDSLWDICEEGYQESCDALYFLAPWASVYEAFGFAYDLYPTWAEDCAAGDDVACDVIWALTPEGSEEEAFAADCGGRGGSDGSWCSAYDDTDPAIDDYGDDPFMDALYDLCDAGMGLACDQLWTWSPLGSAYEQYGQENSFIREYVALNFDDDVALGELYPEWSESCGGGDEVACDLIAVFSTPINSYLDDARTCGGTREPSDDVSCTGFDPATTEAMAYGDDPLLDELYDLCDGGMTTACEALYFGSAVGSEYEAFAEANRG